MSSTPHEYTDAARGERLQKVMAAAGVGSRRGCEELIEAGEVRVNGHLIDALPAWVDPRLDHVTVGGKALRRSAQHVYVMLFKPRGVVCSNADDGEHRRAIDLVRHPSRVRLYPVGRLDVESSGLLLLTNDGELANRLTHPRYGIHKVYDVTVEGRIEDEEVRKLASGVFLSDHHATKGARPGRKTTRSTIRVVRRARDRTRLRIELREGRNRQVRRMLRDVGHKVRKLRRVQMGPLRLSLLKPGQWRDLLPKEIAALQKAAAAQ